MSPEKNIIPTCRHILPSGHYCQANALKDNKLCYHHQRDRQVQANLRAARRVKRLTEPKRQEYRPLDDLNTEILESLDFPNLETAEAIQTSLSNVMRAVYADHISVRRARLMLDAIRNATFNLSHNMLFRTYDLPAGMSDPEPIEPLGNEHGYVMPEEKEVNDSMIEVRAAIAAMNVEEANGSNAGPTAETQSR